MLGRTARLPRYPIEARQTPPANARAGGIWSTSDRERIGSDSEVRVWSCNQDCCWHVESCRAAEVTRRNSRWTSTGGVLAGRPSWSALEAPAPCTPPNMTAASVPEKFHLIPRTRRRSPGYSHLLVAALLSTALAFAAWSRLSPARPADTVAEFERCSIVGYDKSALAGAVPIREEEFLERRDRFARAREYPFFLRDCSKALVVGRGFEPAELNGVSTGASWFRSLLVVQVGSGTAGRSRGPSLRL